MYVIPPQSLIENQIDPHRMPFSYYANIPNIKELFESQLCTEAEFKHISLLYSILELGVPIMTICGNNWPFYNLVVLHIYFWKFNTTFMEYGSKMSLVYNETLLRGEHKWKYR